MAYQQNNQSGARTPPTASVASSGFDFSLGNLDTKWVITLYGPKGTGKTGTALGAPARDLTPGNIFALSFDRKTGRIHESMYDNAPRIVVKDALHYYKENKFDLLGSAVKSYDWIKYLLTHVENNGMNESGQRPDWVVMDYIPKFAEICEMKMRKENNLGAFQGISNRTVWKERKLHMREIHDLAQRVAELGVIYTTYVGTDYAGQVVKDGETLEHRPKPNYIDIIEEETDVVLKQGAEVDKDGRMHWSIFVESNKIRKEYLPLASGETIDLTGRTLGDVFKSRGVKRIGQAVSEQGGDNVGNQTGILEGARSS